jgi:hypothetical protein
MDPPADIATIAGAMPLTRLTGMVFLDYYEATRAS